MKSNKILSSFALMALLGVVMVPLNIMTASHVYAGDDDGGDYDDEEEYSDDEEEYSEEEDDGYSDDDQSDDADEGGYDDGEEQNEDEADDPASGPVSLLDEADAKIRSAEAIIDNLRGDLENGDPFPPEDFENARANLDEADQILQEAEDAGEDLNEVDELLNAINNARDDLEDLETQELNATIDQGAEGLGTLATVGIAKAQGLFSKLKSKYKEKKAASAERKAAAAPKKGSVATSKPLGKPSKPSSKAAAVVDDVDENTAPAPQTRARSGAITRANHDNHVKAAAAATAAHKASGSRGGAKPKSSRHGAAKHQPQATHHPSGRAVKGARPATNSSNPKATSETQSKRGHAAKPSRGGAGHHDAALDANAHKAVKAYEAMKNSFERNSKAHKTQLHKLLGTLKTDMKKAQREQDNQTVSYLQKTINHYRAELKSVESGATAHQSGSRGGHAAKPSRGGAGHHDAALDANAHKAVKAYEAMKKKNRFEKDSKAHKTQLHKLLGALKTDMKKAQREQDNQTVSYLQKTINHYRAELKSVESGATAHQSGSRGGTAAKMSSTGSRAAKRTRSASVDDENAAPPPKRHSSGRSAASSSTKSSKTATASKSNASKRGSSKSRKPSKTSGNASSKSKKTSTASSSSKRHPSGRAKAA